MIVTLIEAFGSQGKENVCRLMLRTEDSPFTEKMVMTKINEAYDELDIYWEVTDRFEVDNETAQYMKSVLLKRYKFKVPDEFKGYPGYTQILDYSDSFKATYKSFK
jgi:hypothetical protein